MSEYTLPAPVEMAAEDMISLVRAVYGDDIEFTNTYQEADYTAILEDVSGQKYVIFKGQQKVDKISG